MQNSGIVYHNVQISNNISINTKSFIFMEYEQYSFFRRPITVFFGLPQMYFFLIDLYLCIKGHPKGESYCSKWANILEKYFRFKLVPMTAKNNEHELLSWLQKSLILPKHKRHKKIPLIQVWRDYGRIQGCASRAVGGGYRGVKVERPGADTGVCK